MGGLGDISSMEAVVVGHIGVIVVLQGHHVGDKRIHRDPKGLQKVSLLQQGQSTEVIITVQPRLAVKSERGLKQK